MENNDCIFCKLVNGEIPCNKVYENKNFIAFLDIHPKAKGHTLIVPKNHYTLLLDMPSSLGAELMDAVKKIILNISKENKAEGFNVIINGNKAGGQVVMHTHVHVIPRKSEDGLQGLV
jgi:histidine triad (HIT) family protein